MGEEITKDQVFFDTQTNTYSIITSNGVIHKIDAIVLEQTGLKLDEVIQYGHLNKQEEFEAIRRLRNVGVKVRRDVGNTYEIDLGDGIIRREQSLDELTALARRLSAYNTPVGNTLNTKPGKSKIGSLALKIGDMLDKTGTYIDTGVDYNDIIKRRQAQARNLLESAGYSIYSSEDGSLKVTSSSGNIWRCKNLGELESLIDALGLGESKASQSYKASCVRVDKAFKNSVYGADTHDLADLADLASDQSITDQKTFSNDVVLTGARCQGKQQAAQAQAAKLLQEALQNADKLGDAFANPNTKTKSIDPWKKFGIKIGDYKKTNINNPLDDPLHDATKNSSNSIAAVDLEEAKLQKPGDPMKIYYHDRWPTKPSHIIIDDAINLLKTKKHISIQVREKHGNITYATNESAYLSFSAKKPISPDIVEYATIADIQLPNRVFDRTKHHLDDDMKLRGRLDTNTYITLRIAWLILEVIKLNECDTDLWVDSDVLKIIGFETRPLFSFSNHL